MPLNKPAALFSPDRVRTARDATVSPLLSFQSYLQARKVSDDSVVGYVGRPPSGYQIVPAGSTTALLFSYSGFAAVDSSIRFTLNGATLLLGLSADTTTTSIMTGSQTTSTSTGVKAWNWDDPYGQVTTAQIKNGIRTPNRIYKRDSSSSPSFISTGTAAPTGYYEIYFYWVTTMA